MVNGNRTLPINLAVRECRTRLANCWTCVTRVSRRDRLSSEVIRSSSLAPLSVTSVCCNSRTANRVNAGSIATRRSSIFVRLTSLDTPLHEVCKRDWKRRYWKPGVFLRRIEIATRTSASILRSPRSVVVVPSKSSVSISLSPPGGLTSASSIMSGCCFVPGLVSGARMHPKGDSIKLTSRTFGRCSTSTNPASPPVQRGPI